MRIKRIIIRILPDGEQNWKVTRSDNSYGWKLFKRVDGKTKQDAIEYARHVAGQTRKHGNIDNFIRGQVFQIVIHKRDGTIQEERTYGADPEKSKG